MIKTSVFGKLNNGAEVLRHTIKNNSGMKLSMITFGAIVTNLFVPDRKGSFADVVLGYDSLDGYITDNTFMGGIVGRYGNRIAKGKFRINEEEYQLTINNGENHLHGGKNGFHKVLWNSETEENPMGDSITLTYLSVDGEDGYPGNLILKVVYTLTNDGELMIAYSATTDKTTIINPTHHSYFNLSGNLNTSILGHELQIDADHYLPVDKGQIPLGAPELVESTAMDFRLPVPAGLHIDEANEQMAIGNGYDHTWVLNNYNGAVKKVATLYDPSSGRVMEVVTDQPGLHFYSGNSLDGSMNGKGGIRHDFRTGLCLEAQFFPDSPNNSSYPSTLLKPGSIYKQETRYKFSVQ